MPDTGDPPRALPANWPNAEYSSFVTAAGMRWHVQRAGVGPTVVLVHGTAGATFSWSEIFPRLMAHADVIAFDLPGHGFTTGASTDQLSLTGMSNAVAALLRALNVQPEIGVGHSAGAAVLLQLAASNEVTPQSIIGVNSALVSINALGQFLLPFSRTLFDVEPVRATVAALLRGGTLARALLRSTGTALDPIQEARYVSMLTDETRVGAVLQMMARWDLPPLLSMFPHIPLPVTLVHSRNEPWVPVGELMEATRTLPMRSVIDVTPAGHLIPDEKPREVADIIAAACASLASRTS